MDFSLFTDVSSILFIVLFGLITYTIIKQCRRPSGMPPGPRLWPIAGNMLSITGKHNLIEAFRELRRQYGDIYSLKLGSSWIVVINGHENLKDALVKQGDMFSDRPDNFFFTRLLQHQGIIGSSGLLWKESRFFTQKTLKDFGFGKRSLQDKIMEEVTILLKTIENTKGETFTLKPLIQGVFSNIVTSIMFNRRFDYDDPQMMKIRDMLHEHLTDSEFSGILDAIPFLESFPGDLFHAKRLLTVERKLDEFIQKCLDEHKQTLDENNILDYTDAYLSEMKKRQKEKDSVFSERQLVRICRDILLAGTDTTATNIRWAILHLICKPEIQERMFLEIQEVIGLERPPEMNDRLEMPYCDAVCNETMRVSNVAPLSAPRSTRGDVKFQGYRIPAETIVYPCLDSVLFDEKIYPNPEEFIPDRFLEGSKISTAMTKLNIPFSLGRRSCPGDVLSRQELFLTIISLVRRFKFLPPDGSGPPAKKRIFGVIFFPAEYKLRAILRN
ncbi:cytochrome P450 2B4-like [Mytilus californianus]|uniref:cytochrome P450 2B4-like n=1 Tax=Mytilus californianus TaxID=6549 RepID=UPI002246BB6A|nr:cytochrome P450 2B4-like [Mytilus californianus]